MNSLYRFAFAMFFLAAPTETPKLSGMRRWDYHGAFRVQMCGLVKSN